MKLTIIPVDKTIVLDGEVVICNNVDLSWIASDVHAVHWDSTTSKGQVEYNDLSKFPTYITEIGDWQQAVTDHANEKTAAAAAYEAARNHLTEVKNHRNWLLAVSDWTRLDDVTLAADKKTAWQTYRQALRDITTQADPFNVSWPTEPT